MNLRLWHMNADFETELSHGFGVYRRPQKFDALNRRLAPHLLWLAHPGDALWLPEPWPEDVRREARRRGVKLFSPEQTKSLASHVFTPWGWTRSAAAAGEQSGATIRSHPSFETVARVNSKLWSHALEVELGWAMPGASAVSSLAGLRETVARVCRAADDKWVVKSPHGFAARERVLGRGPVLDAPQAKWCERHLARGEPLIFQPWLEVIREYGITLEISARGSCDMRGISDLQTNGAGTGRGYLLGRRPTLTRLTALEHIAAKVGARLYKEGYYGPVGIDALEHTRGFHPLLEINARYTMGFVALAVEKRRAPAGEVFWSLK